MIKSRWDSKACGNPERIVIIQPGVDMEKLRHQTNFMTRVSRVCRAAILKGLSSFSPALARKGLRRVNVTNNIHQP
jgi:hypothetical protein